MPHYVHAVADSPWVLIVVFLVAGLDAVLPFMPSESTVVAVGVVAAGTGRPHLAALILVAAAGAYAGDLLACHAGRRSTRAVLNRLQRGRRARAVHNWVHRLLHSRGGLVIVFARYIPGGRSTTAFAAGIVGYPARRFRWYTGLGVLLWAIEAALLGYLGGSIFADHPLLGLLVAWTGALAVTGLAILVQRLADRPRRGSPERGLPGRPAGLAPQAEAAARQARGSQPVSPPQVEAGAEQIRRPRRG
jgi:membrane-associated protein